jgi:hypothetical protein
MIKGLAISLFVNSLNDWVLPNVDKRARSIKPLGAATTLHH